MQGLNYLHELFFGVLGKEYCNFFYFLMVIQFLGLITAAVAVLTNLLTSKKLNLYMVVASLSYLVLFSFGYITQRMLYSMCLN